MINPIGNKGPDEPLLSKRSEEAAAAKKTASTQGDQKTQESESPKGDKVELSSLARDMQAIRARLGDEEAARAARVEALRKQVEDGTYSVDTKALAQKMYDSGLKG